MVPSITIGDKIYTKRNKWLKSSAVFFMLGVFLFLFFFGVRSVYAAREIDCTADFSSCNGLKGYWKANESSGASVSDSSGLGRTGAIVGGTTFVAGKINNGIYMDGAGDIVNIGNIADFDNNAKVSYSVWVKPDASQPGTATGILTKGVGGPVHIFACASNRFGFTMRGSNNGYDAFGADNTYTAGNWYHIVVVYDNSLSGNGIQTAYVNGIKQTGSTIAGGGCSSAVSHAIPSGLLLWDNNDNFAIGGRHTGGTSYDINFKGAVDELTAWNRALTQADVTKLYNLGSRTNAPTSSNFSILLGSTDFYTATSTASVPNMKLATASGSIQWANTVDASNDDYNANVRIGTDFVSVNTSSIDATTYSTATIKLNVSGCENYKLYSAKGFRLTANHVRNNGSICNASTTPACSSVSCSGGVVTFTVPYVESYAFLSDNAGPTIPGDVSFGAITSTPVTLSWTASTDTGSGLADPAYYIERAPDSAGSPGTWAQIAATNALAYTDNSLLPTTKYWFRLRAKDDFDNYSQYSTSTSATTGVGPAYRYVIVPLYTTTTEGIVTEVFTVGLRDIVGNVVTAYTDQSLYVIPGSGTVGLTATGTFTNVLNHPITAGETQMQFYYKSFTTGTYSVVISDTNPANGDTGLLDALASTDVLPGQPRTVTFPAIYGTTDFSSISDYTDIPNMKLGTGSGYIQWVDNVNALGEDYDNNVRIGTNYVSINRSALNASVYSPITIRMNVTDCNNYGIYFSTGYHSSASAVQVNGTFCDADSVPACTNVSCSGGVLQFDAPYIESFSMVTDAEGPTAPSNVTVLSVASTSASISWTASVDTNSGLKAVPYTILRAVDDGGVPGSWSTAGISATTSYTATGLAPSTKYWFKIKAIDKVRNYSPDSSSISTTTAMGTPYRLTVNPSSRTFGVNETSGFFGISLRDVYGNILPANGDKTIYITPPSGQVSASAGGTFTNTLTTSILSGQTSAIFYYRNATIGNYTITISDSAPADGDAGLLDTSASITVERALSPQTYATSSVHFRTTSTPQTLGSMSGTTLSPADTSGGMQVIGEIASTTFSDVVASALPTEIYSVDSNSTTASILLSNVQTAAATNPSDDIVKYTDIYSDVDIYYQVFSDHIKEDIVLRSASAQKFVTFRVELPTGATLVADGNGGLSAMLGGNLVYYFYQPSAIDFNNVTFGYHYDISSLGAGDYNVSVNPDDPALTGAVYPVVIDPTMSWEFNVSSDYTLSNITEIEVVGGVVRLVNVGGNYSTNNPWASNNTPIAYDTLISFAETLGAGNAGTVKYQLSPDNTNWYYHDGSAWTLTTAGYTETNTANEVNANIADFGTSYGPGNLYFKAYLHAPSISSPVELESLDIGYTSSGGGGGTGYATGTTSASLSWNVTLDVTAEIALTCDTSDLFLGTINGMGGGVAENSRTCNVETNNSGGWELQIAATDAVAMHSPSNTFPNYSEATPGIPEPWSVASTSAAFGYSVAGTKIKAGFGATNYLGLTTSNFTVAEDTAGTNSSGVDTTFNFKAEVGSLKNQPSGDYVAHITATAIIK